MWIQCFHSFFIYFLLLEISNTFTIAYRLRVTAGTPFYSLIYTLQSRDLNNFSHVMSLRYFRCKHLIYNGVKSHFKKIIYCFDILFKTNPLIINLTWYNCDISSRASIIFYKKGPGKGGGEDGRWSDKLRLGWSWVKMRILDNVLSTFTLYIIMYKFNNLNLTI